jgi:hypothetical protein
MSLGTLVCEGGARPLLDIAAKFSQISVPKKSPQKYSQTFASIAQLALFIGEYGRIQMKITKSQLQQIIAEELEGFEAGPREQAPMASVPCYLVYINYRDYEESVEYAAGSIEDVQNYLSWWSRRYGRPIEGEGYTIIKSMGVDGEDITQEVLGGSQ